MITSLPVAHTTRWALLASRSRPAAVIGSIAMVFVALGPTPGVGAQVEFVVRAMARADAASFEVIDPGAPVVPGGQAVFASPATAQTTIDLPGVSEGFASMPYPGDTIAALPGTANGVMAGSGFPALPLYPFIVSSSHPVTPKSSAQHGPYSISASSDANDSRAEAKAHEGEDRGGATIIRAGAHTYEGEGHRAVAEATTDLGGITLGDTVRVGEVSSFARAAQAPGEEADRKSGLSGQVTVGGQAVRFSERGFEAGPVPPVPLPGVEPVPNLSQAGVNLAIVPSTQSDTGIVSAALKVSYVVDVPGRGRVRLEAILGRVGVSATASDRGRVGTDLAPPTEGSPSGAVPALPIDAPEPGVGEPPASGTVLLDGPSAQLLPRASSGTSYNEVTWPAAGEAVSDTAASPTESSSAAGPSRRPAGTSELAASRIATSARGLYVMLAGAACALFLTSQLLRLLVVGRP